MYKNEKMYQVRNFFVNRKKGENVKYWERRVQAGGQQRRVQADRQIMLDIIIAEL